MCQSCSQSWAAAKVFAPDCWSEADSEPVKDFAEAACLELFARSCCSQAGSRPRSGNLQAAPSSQALPFAVARQRALKAEAPEAVLLLDVLLKALVVCKLSFAKISSKMLVSWSP